MKLTLTHVISAAVIMVFGALLYCSFVWWTGGVPEWGLYMERAGRAISGMVLLWAVVWWTGRGEPKPNEQALVVVSKYARWLADRHETVFVLDNLAAELAGEPMDICHPPSARGPWEISRLVLVIWEVFGHEAPSPRARPPRHPAPPPDRAMRDTADTDATFSDRQRHRRQAAGPAVVDGV